MTLGHVYAFDKTPEKEASNNLNPLPTKLTSATLTDVTPVTTTEPIAPKEKFHVPEMGVLPTPRLPPPTPGSEGQHTDSHSHENLSSEFLGGRLVWQNNRRITYNRKHPPLNQRASDAPLAQEVPYPIGTEADPGTVVPQQSSVPTTDPHSSPTPISCPVIRACIGFCGGAGGTSSGIDEFNSGTDRPAHIDVRAAYDFDPEMLRLHHHNHPQTPTLLMAVESTRMWPKLAQCRPWLTFSSPPCTEFSGEGGRKEGAVANAMLVDIQLNTFLGSQIHITEQVTDFRNSGKSELYRESLAQRGWDSVALTVKRDRCGLVTTRRRLFFVSIRKGPHTEETLQRLARIMEAVIAKGVADNSIGNTLQLPEEGTVFVRPRRPADQTV